MTDHQESASAVGVSLLVVDDDKMNLEMLCRRLKRQGFMVTEAYDGQQALDLIETQPFDVVILDVMLPDINGFDVLEKVRRTRSMADLPIIMATAMTQSSDIVEALEMGANDYVTKPIDLPVLCARIKTQLAHRHAKVAFEEREKDLHIALEPGVAVSKRYEIMAPIKSGGMGAVYRARDLHFRDRQVALKAMRQDVANEATRKILCRKFEEEANILAGLSHAGIPQVMDYFILGDVHYIVMELIEGDSLDQIFRDALSRTRKPVPVRDVVDYAVQICEVLVYLHHIPVIHRDIKPGNIIMRRSTERCTLVDFGLARSVDLDTEEVKTAAGTLGYAPLEQVQGHPESRSDLYALGATMSQLISGKRPVPFDIEPLQKLWPPSHPSVAAVVDRAVEPDLVDRFQTADEMLAALRTAQAALEKDPSGIPRAAS